MLDYLLPSEDIEDLVELQKIPKDIEIYDFSNLINKFYELLNVYIYYILFSLLIVFFSTTYSNANTFNVSNI